MLLSGTHASTCKAIVRSNFSEVTICQGSVSLVEVYASIKHPLLLLINAHHSQVSHEVTSLLGSLAKSGSVVRSLASTRGQWCTSIRIISPVY